MDSFETMSAFSVGNALMVMVSHLRSTSYDILNYAHFLLRKQVHEFL